MATAKQNMPEEEVALLERRLTARQLRPLSTVFDLMIDEINALEPTTSTEWEKMKQLKNDIIRRCIETGRGVEEKFSHMVLLEKEKYFVKRDVDQSTSEWQSAVIDSIEIRRLYMIERASRITQFKLATNFKNN